jgi:hypothetical protein
MEQLMQFFGQHRNQVYGFSVLFVNGIYAITKADAAWGMGIIVSILASWNYIDQMIQRRKNKSK